MSKVRILAVAPYDGMRDVLSSVAAGRDDVEVTTVVANMERGADYVAHCDQSRYDVIVSRGGTARLIEEVADLPVIEIELTPYDIHSALSQVSGVNRNFAVAGFPSIVEAAATLSDILNTGIQAVSIRDDAEARAVFPLLRQQGIELLLCDVGGMEAAPEFGLETVLITSGVKGIEDALNKAATYFSSVDRARLAAAVYDAELAALGENLVVLNAAGQIVFSAPEHAVPPALRKLLGRLVPAVLSDGQFTASRPAGSKEYAISASAITFRGERCAVFRFRSKGYRLPVSTPGVRFYDSSEKDMTLVSRHYGTPDSCQLVRADKISRSGLPVLITGEKGTLTRSMAGYICMNGLLSERDCVVVDCSAVGAKGWAKLLGQSGLLAFRTGSTLLLVVFLQDADLARQLRFVFVLTTGLYPQREQAVIRLLCDRLYCVRMDLPPLRERDHAFRSVIESCFTFVCADMGVRVPQMEDGAMQALLDYGWPRNYPQLYRVTTQLVADCKDGCLSAAQVEAVLGFEKSQLDLRPPKRTDLDLSGTLEDIDYRVVVQVLAEEGMNRSRTARRLGISRATLWRILGREE